MWYNSSYCSNLLGVSLFPGSVLHGLRRRASADRSTIVVEVQFCAGKPAHADLTFVLDRFGRSERETPL